MRPSAKLFFLTTAFATLIQAAQADDVARRTIEIRGIVPVVCKADYTPEVIDQGDGTVRLGKVAEFCNAGHGYKVIVDYAGGADPGALIVDGRSVELGASGSAVIGQQDGPAIVTQQLVYRPGTTPLSSLHIRLEAILA